ncbi:MAG: 50S ribosomal protein L11 methyltransferase [Desulfobacula sp.]|uniref:50S ribosomal protein L11 methyltransferase n=1 Tax=Desulfobacula sp. TaxID=2593537 RepID=UPI0039B8D616|nr:50S ribosomal protein L11 methyltransferase [Desulfobacula sp.]
MKFKKVIARFYADNIDLAEELICNIFFSLNLKGVVCDVPLEEPDEGFGTNTLPKPEICSITGFLPLIDSSDIMVENIRKKTADLSHLDIKVDLQIEIVDEQDWAHAWKTYFEVTPITDRITIKPAWKDHASREDEIVIHLDPGMAFGTGTHPTTAMCIQLIEKFLEPGSSFLDVGTGSGILMIAAAGLGAGQVTGIDTDEVAIDVAKKNLDKNNIGPENYDLLCTTLDKIGPGPWRFIAVNIIAQVIVPLLPEISKRMTKKTILVLSGIIRERQNDVLSAMKAHTLYVIHEEYTDEWVCLAVKKKANK